MAGPVKRLEENKIKDFRFQCKNEHFSFLFYDWFFHQAPMHNKVDNFHGI